MADQFSSFLSESEAKATDAFLRHYYHENDRPELVAMLNAPETQNKQFKIRVICFTCILARLDTLHDFCNASRTMFKLADEVIARMFPNKTTVMRYITDIKYEPNIDILSRNLLLKYADKLMDYKAFMNPSFEHTVIAFVRLVRKIVFNLPSKEILDVTISDNHDKVGFKQIVNEKLNLSQKGLDIFLDTSNFANSAMCEQPYYIINSAATIYDKMGKQNSGCLTQRYDCSETILRRAFGEMTEFEQFIGKPYSCSTDAISEVLYNIDGNSFSSENLEDTFGVPFYGRLVNTIIYREKKAINEEIEKFCNVFKLDCKTQDKDVLLRKIFDLKRVGDWGIVLQAKRSEQLGREDPELRKKSLMTLDGPCYAKSLLTFDFYNPTESNTVMGTRSVFTSPNGKGVKVTFHDTKLSESSKKYILEQIQTFKENYSKLNNFLSTVQNNGQKRAYLTTVYLQGLNYYIHDSTIDKYKNTLLDQHDKAISDYKLLMFMYEVLGNAFLKICFYHVWISYILNVQPKSKSRPKKAKTQHELTDVIKEKTRQTFQDALQRQLSIVENAKDLIQSDESTLLSVYGEVQSFLYEHHLNEPQNYLFIKSIIKDSQAVLDELQQDIETGFVAFTTIAEQKNITYACNYLTIPNPTNPPLFLSSLSNDLPIQSIVLSAIETIKWAFDFSTTEKGKQAAKENYEGKGARSCNSAFDFKGDNRDAFLTYQEYRESFAIENISILSRIVELSQHFSSYHHKYKLIESHLRDIDRAFQEKQPPPHRKVKSISQSEVLEEPIKQTQQPSISKKRRRPGSRGGTLPSSFAENIYSMCRLVPQEMFYCTKVLVSYQTTMLGGEVLIPTNRQTRGQPQGQSRTTQNVSHAVRRGAVDRILQQEATVPRVGHVTNRQGMPNPLLRVADYSRYGQSNTRVRVDQPFYPGFMNIDPEPWPPQLHHSQRDLSYIVFDKWKIMKRLGTKMKKIHENQSDDFLKTYIALKWYEFDYSNDILIASTQFVNDDYSTLYVNKIHFFILSMLFKILKEREQKSKVMRILSHRPRKIRRTRTAIRTIAGAAKDKK